MGDQLLPIDGIKFLREKLSDCGNMVAADNLQMCHNCTAGINSCGITYCGDVIACLSQRTFLDKIYSYGNIFDRDLQDIWESEFKDIRFGDYEHTCRDFITYPKTPVIGPPNYPEVQITPVYSVITPPQEDVNPWPTQPNVTLYGVTTPGVIAYGVIGSRTDKTWTVLDGLPKIKKDKKK